jgi:hypothetical protein
MHPVRQAIFRLIGFLVRHGFLVVIVVLGVYALVLYLPQPDPRKPWLAGVLEELPMLLRLPQVVPPTMVKVPVPTEAIAAGQVIDGLDGPKPSGEPGPVVEMRVFVSADLDGRIVDPNELQHTIAKRVLVRGQPIPTDAVEAYVELPVAERSLSAGTLIAYDHANFNLRPFPRSVEHDDKILRLDALNDKLVVNPIPAFQPIPRASVDSYVVLPVLRFALANGARFEEDNVRFKIVPYRTVENDLGTLVLDRADLLNPPKLVNGDHLSPDTPIKRAAHNP